MTAQEPSAFENLDLLGGEESWGSRDKRADGAGLEPIFSELSKLLAPVGGDSKPTETPLTRMAHDLLVLTCALAHAPIDPEQVVAVRRIRDIRFARSVKAGEPVRVVIGVERARREDDNRSVVETVWRVVDTQGQTFVQLRVDLLCAGGEETPLELSSLLLGGAEPGSVGAEFECVDNIPV